MINAKFVVGLKLISTLVGVSDAVLKTGLLGGNDAISLNQVRYISFCAITILTLTLYFFLQNIQIPVIY